MVEKTPRIDLGAAPPRSASPRDRVATEGSATTSRAPGARALPAPAQQRTRDSRSFPLPTGARARGGGGRASAPHPLSRAHLSATGRLKVSDGTVCRGALRT